MARTFTTRRTSGIITVALALGIAAPAGARLDLNTAGSFVPSASSQRPVQSASVTPSPASGDDISGVGYLAIGTGGAAVALIGIGGTRAVSRRRQPPSATRRSTTAA